MKTKKVLQAFILSGIILISGQVFAQGKGKDKKEEKLEMKMEKEKNKHENKVKEKKEEHNRNLNEVKENNGNAYGKNKGDLSGREFGQQRAAEARAKIKKGMDDIEENEERLRGLRDKVDEIKKEETDREKLERILKAEEQIKKAEDEAKKAKEILIKKDRELKDILGIE